MSAPVLSWLFTALGKQAGACALVPQNAIKRESTLRLAAASSLGPMSFPGARPLRPTLRANPFPEVTDPICRLPLPTLH